MNNEAKHTHDIETVRDWLLHGGYPRHSLSEYASRIVTCVNACKGISTEQLESDYKQGYEPWGHAERLKKQRDELLAFVRDLLAIIEKHGGITGVEQVVAESARSLIARAEGKE